MGFSLLAPPCSLPQGGFAQGFSVLVLPVPELIPIQGVHYPQLFNVSLLQKNASPGSQSFASLAVLVSPPSFLKPIKLAP